MSVLVEVFRWLNLAVYLVLAAVAVIQWRRRRGRGALWAAFTFSVIGVALLVLRLLPEDPSGLAELLAVKSGIVLVLVFPFLLYKFATVFDPPSRRLDVLAGSMSAVMVAWTYASPEFPQDDEPRPGWFTAYLVAFVLHWAVLSSVAAVKLWRAGARQPSVARRRLRFLAGAAALLTAAILVAAFGNGDESGFAAFTQVVAFVGALGFLLALAPPTLLRVFWRLPEQRRLQEATEQLLTARTATEVAARVLEPVADIVGARAVTIRDRRQGTVIGSHNVPDDILADLHAGRPARAFGRTQLYEVDVGDAGLAVWTSPYAPYFGGEELELLRGLAAFTGLALGRARADELKTNFIALAAHELRTPVTTIHGFAQTLSALADRLDEQQTAELRAALAGETGRLTVLVEQLLDLSRLDAEAVDIAPQPMRVRDRIVQIVGTAAADRAGAVSVEVADELETVVDPHAFDRIVTNLLTNALRYGEPPVVVAAEQTDRHFRLSVEDRGPGVEPRFVGDLFERFTRSARSGERLGGTGLGLAIARSYARAHGGDLVYEEARPHGARFNLVLPPPSA